MSRILLIIKGNRSDAETQARRRNLTIEINAESDNYNQTYAYCSTIDRPKIIDWYCEGGDINKVAQRGECLWYSTPIDES